MFDTALVYAKGLQGALWVWSEKAGASVMECRLNGSLPWLFRAGEQLS